MKALITVMMIMFSASDIQSIELASNTNCVNCGGKLSGLESSSSVEETTNAKDIERKVAQETDPNEGLDINLKAVRSLCSVMTTAKKIELDGVTALRFEYIMSKINGIRFSNPEAFSAANCEKISNLWNKDKGYHKVQCPPNEFTMYRSSPLRHMINATNLEVLSLVFDKDGCFQFDITKKEYDGKTLLEWLDEEIQDPQSPSSVYLESLQKIRRTWILPYYNYWVEKNKKASS
jgi:hypothetical protein